MCKYKIKVGFPGSSLVTCKESTCNTGDPSSIPRSGRFPRKWTDYYPLQYSWGSLVLQTVKHLPALWDSWVGKTLEEDMATHCSILAWRIPMDRGAWWATVHGVTKSWTWLTKVIQIIICVLSHSVLTDSFITPSTGAHQDPVSMEFSRPEYWNGLPFPSPGMFPIQGSNLSLLFLLHCRQILYYCAIWEAIIICT